MRRQLTPLVHVSTFPALYGARFSCIQQRRLDLKGEGFDIGFRSWEFVFDFNADGSVHSRIESSARAGACASAIY